MTSYNWKFSQHLSAAILSVCLLLAIAGSANACACCDSYRVTNVADGDQLNIRSAAHPQAPWVGAIPPGYCGIMRTGPHADDAFGNRWVQITYNNMIGWVNSNFIEWVSTAPNRPSNLPPASHSNNRPYWCTRTNLNSAEATVCGYSQLWDLDGAIGTAYGRARFDSPHAAEAIRQQQQAWLGFRNACGYDVQCLTSRYENQIRWLEGYFNN